MNFKHKAIRSWVKLKSILINTSYHHLNPPDENYRPIGQNDWGINFWTNQRQCKNGCVILEEWIYKYLEHWFRLVTKIQKSCIRPIRNAVRKAVDIGRVALHLCNNWWWFMLLRSTQEFVQTSRLHELPYSNETFCDTIYQSFSKICTYISF